jgi:trimeric autotransporter adhesin
MRKIYFALAAVTTLSLFLIFVQNSKKALHPQFSNEVFPVKPFVESEQEDDMDKAIEFEIEKTRDIKLGYVPTQKLLVAKEQQKQKFTKQNNIAIAASAVPGITWAERGPTNIGGRTRAVWFDLNDVTFRKVWAAGVGGGLWVTADITVASPVWTKQNDLFANIAITSFAQSSANKQDMYFGTGEGWFNADAIRGLGIWYSGDGGATWNQLASTNNSSFQFVQKIVVDNAGNVYACTKSGLQKSTNKGVSWTNVLNTGSANILPGSTSALNNDAADIEIAANGDLYCSIGMVFSTGKIYRSVNGGTTWTDISPAIVAGRIELACAPSNANIVYALFHNNSDNNCSDIQKYDASGGTWTAGTVPTIIDQGNNSNFTRGQAWYDLIAAVDPSNANSLYIGGVDALRSDDAGLTWTQMSTWSLFAATGFTAAQNVHADQHAIIYQPGSSAIALWATDGGIFRTTNANSALPTKPTWTSKNSSYDITQYYSVAIHPTTTNYLMGGTQDNGTHRLTSAGLGAGTTLTGGDGGFAHIDQENGNIQISSFTNNNFVVTTDGWSTGSQSSFAGGSFINPTDYDDAGKYLYGAYSTSSSASVAYFRWTSPSTNGAFQTFSPAGFPPGSPPSSSPTIRNVTVSPITLNRVYFGFNNGAVIRVDNTNTATPVATTIKSAGSPAASVSCIAIDPSDENHVLITYSNYGSNSVLESANALSGSPTWANDLGNLPDMPVRWAIFDPRNSDWVILATELGIWSTDNLNAGATDWQPTNNGFANTRVDMLQYRSSDRLLAAATHGRGIFTTNIPASGLPGIKFEKGLNAKTEQTTTPGCRSYTDYTVNMLIESAPVGDATVTLDVKVGNTAVAGIDFDFTTNGNFAALSNVLTFANGSTASKTVSIRIYNDAEVEGSENFTLEYAISGITNATRAVAPQTFSFEIGDNDLAAAPSTYSGSFAVGTFNNPAINFESPLQSSLQKFRIQYLFTAAELMASGITGAGSINSMKLRVVTKNSTKAYTGFTIAMGNTNATNLSTGFTSAAFTTVYSGNYSSVVGDNLFTFSSPFNWDGASNVVVNCCFDNAPGAPDAMSDIMEGTTEPLGAGVYSTTFSNATVGSGCSLAAAFISTDRVTATFGAISGNPIETVLNNTRTEFVANNGVYHFYNGINIINKLNNASANLGCVSSNVFEAGNTWQTFSGGFRSQKVVDIIPTTNSGASYAVGLYFTAAELAGKDPATLRIAKTTAATMAAANSGNTIIAGATSFSAFGTGYLFTATFTGFSKFFLIDNNVALPVTLLSFDAVFSNKTIQLNWKTSSEQNSKQFEVEKSADGVKFYNIGTVSAAGSSSSERSYHLTDKELNEFNYYRLKMVDLDGKYVMSKTVLIKIADIKQNVRLINNPFRSYLELRVARLPQQSVYMELMTIDGKKIYNKEAASSNSIRLELSAIRLSAGPYLLRTRVDGVWYINKVLKE